MGIFEADTIKQAEMKEKKSDKRTSDERETKFCYRKLIKRIMSEQSPCKIIKTILKMYQERTQKSEPKNEKVDLVWFGLVLWHINLCRLFNAKSIFM